MSVWAVRESGRVGFGRLAAIPMGNSCLSPCRARPAVEASTARGTVARAGGDRRRACERGKVSEATNFGAIGGTGQAEAGAIVGVALDAGINVVDMHRDRRVRGEHQQGHRRDAVTTSSSPRRPCRSDMSTTTEAARAVGWSPGSTTACAASASTTSTSSRCITEMPPPVTRRHSALTDL